MKALTCKRGISLMMALVLCLAGILGIGTTTAYAAGEQAEVYQIAFPRDGDANYHSEWGHPALQFMNGCSTGDTDQTTVRAMHSYTGEICYCIEVGVGQYTGDVYTNKGEDFWDNYPSSYNSTIAPDDIKLLIGRILQYGYTGNISTSWRSQNEGADSLAHAVATQLLIWETVVGERDAEFRHVSTGGYNAIVEQVSTGHPLYSRIMSYYSSIEASVQNHSALPSFMGRTPGSAQTVELTWDGGAYTASLTDSNGVLSEYSFAAESGIEFAVSGNTLTITAAEAPSDSLVITAEKDAPRRGVITWTDGKIGPNGGTQDMVTYAQTVSDPVKGFLNLKVSYGSARIVKVSEDGVVEGIPFHVSGNGVDTTVTTGAGGEIQIDNLAPGEYTVTEESIDRYVPQESKTVTVLSGQTATVEFSNVLKKFTVTLTKSDSEKGEAQGDATLEKAVYGIYKGDELVDTYETDASGSFTTAEYICGPDWTVQEITPSEGYLLDEALHPVGAEPGNFTIEHNAVAMGVTEEVIKGNVALIKHTDDGETQIETPEAGAEFQIYLASAGSFDEADPDERDVLVCDEDGFAQSKDLPYGEYVVEQTKGWDGRELMPAFTVCITEHGKTYKYLINNAEFKAYLKAVKVDAETEKSIPYAGAVFQIYDPSGNLVEMTTTYPDVVKHTEFSTNEEGYLITPEMLPYGVGYSLVEIQAPYGYVLNSEPVYFDVTAEDAVSEEGITIVIAEKPNMPQKGKIILNKQGEVFASVTEQDGRYTPVYAESGLEGAEFTVQAAEDIYTPDGTLRYAKGEMVETLVTSADGTAESKELYLGKYEIVETKAPYGMVKSDEILTAELVYAGQEIAVTSTSVSLYNERQKVEVKLYKDLEKDELFQIGMGDEILNIYFALYAKEELTAADGSMIPADGLIEIAGVQADGTLTFTADLPIGSYYVKEYAVDEQYLISEEIYPVTFSYDDETVAVVKIEINNGEAILNKIIRGSITGVKVNEASEPLPGTVFGLFRADCIEFTEENAILTAASAEDGSFAFENVPYGVWLVREIAAVEGYVLSDELFEVQVSEEGAVIELGEIENKPITGELELTKKDISDGKLLPNAGFRIKDADGNVVTEGYTDENGIARFTLRYGKYTYEEFTAPDGYLLDTTPHEFEITEDGQVVKAEMTNEKVPAPEVPQTGDTSNLGFWIGLAGVALGALVAVGIMYFKKKKGDDGE